MYKMSDPVRGKVISDLGVTNVHVQSKLTGCNNTELRARTLDACLGRFIDIETENITVNNIPLTTPVVSVVASAGSGLPFDALQTLTTVGSPVVPVEFNVIQQDDFGMYDPVTFTWTVPFDGVYSLTFNICWNLLQSSDPTATWLIGAAWQIIRGGSVLNEQGKDLRSIGGIPPEPPNVRSNSLTVVVPLLANDEVRVIANLQGGPGTMDILATASGTFPGSTLATIASVHRI
jgi:hypothetical protein